jgi:hypothetical protein
MHWPSLSEYTSKWYRHLHTSIYSFRSLLNLSNVWFILGYTRGPLINKLCYILLCWCIYSWRLRSNYHIIMFKTTFPTTSFRSYLNLSPCLKMSKRLSSLTSFKSIINYLIFHQYLLVLHQHMFRCIPTTFLWHPNPLINRLTLWYIPKCIAILRDIKVLVWWIFVTLLHILDHGLI